MPDGPQIKKEGEKMRLTRLKLLHFKGIESLEIKAPKGEDIIISGQNGAGKTTVADAIFWVLLGKDSLGRADFEIKTLNSDGESVHGVEHTVEAEFDIGKKKTLTLTRIFKEKWTKPRGKAKPVFSGHETNFQIGGTPVKKNEYEARISEAIGGDEEVFRLLTDPSYFPEKYPWKKRRDLLMEMAPGDLTDDAVFSRNGDELRPLRELMAEGKSFEDIQREIKADRAKINKEIEEIPHRIDEVSRSVISVDQTPVQLKEEFYRLENELEAKKTAVKEMRAGGGGASIELKRGLRAIQDDIDDLIRSQKGERGEVLNQAKDAHSDTLREWQLAENSLSIAETLARNLSAERGRIDTELGNLREEWARLDGQRGEAQTPVFDYEPAAVCPTCGQALPEDQIAEAYAKAKADFNRAKADSIREIDERLQAIEDKGKELNRRRDEIERDIDATQADITQWAGRNASLEATLKKRTARVAEIESWPEITAPAQLLQKRDKIAAQIKRAEEGGQVDTTEIEAQIASIKSKISHCEQTLSQIKHNETAAARISELTARQRELAEQYDKNEALNAQADEFIRLKAEALEESINSRFEICQWRLFEQQINEGINEVCECLVNGVPYSAGLNNGARKNAGLDCINQLGKHFGLTMPVIIDNAEAVNELLPTEAQQIKLVVTSDDDLTIEVG